MSKVVKAQDLVPGDEFVRAGRGTFAIKVVEKMQVAEQGREPFERVRVSGHYRTFEGFERSSMLLAFDQLIDVENR